MSDPERFVTRWSRRKREAVEEAPDTAAALPVEPGTEEARSDKGAAAPPATEAEAVVPEVDLTKLPALESITAETEIRAFLARGVPDQLKHAALRRAWAADPAIRDFVGLSENSWDFTAADSMPGFGPLLPVDDVGRMLANLTREAEPPVTRIADSTDKPDSAAPEPAESAQELGAVEGSEEAATTTESYPPGEPTPAVVAAPPDQATETKDGPVDIAAQNQAHPADDGTVPSHRGHGGAVPR